MTTEPYSRVYWRVRDEYPDVWGDDATLGTWLRLLVIAEGAHPAAADLPRKVRPASLSKLVDEGLVILYPGDRYRIKGLQQERERRSEAARKGGLASSRSRSSGTNAEQPSTERSASVAPSVNLDETRRDETRQDETRNTTRASGFESVAVVLPDAVATLSDPIPVDVRRLQRLAEELTQQPYVMGNTESGLARKAISEQLPHGFDRVERAWRKAAARVRSASGPSVKPTLRQLVFGADDELNAIPHADSAEQRDEQARAAYDRRVERTQREIAEMKRHLDA